MRNVSFKLQLVQVTLTVAFVAIGSVPLFVIANTHSETKRASKFPDTSLAFSDPLLELPAPPIEATTEETSTKVDSDGEPIPLVTEAAEQNKDAAITEVVELIDDIHSPRELERRISNRSYWIGNCYLDPLVLLEQPVLWLFVLAVLAMFSPKSYAAKEAHGRTSMLQALAVMIKSLAYLKFRRLMKFVPLDFEFASIRPLILPFLLYACSFCFLLGLGCQMYTPCLWAVGFGFGFSLVCIRAYKTIGALGCKILRSLLGALMLVSGACVLAVTLMIMPSWSKIDPLLISLSLFISSTAVIAALFLVRFRFSVIKRIASMKHVSAIGTVLVLVSFGSGLFYGDNKIITYVDPARELHTFW